ncbi:MAG: glycosyl hydrolase, partial [Bacteroidales bacterium]|nr:glycosyl hydrolase [Bacteroidales bacterium]
LSIVTGGNNFQAHRLRVAVSDDGKNFRQIKQLVPARRGWQDTDADATYTLPETTARYYRFYWSPEGTEPAAEDIDPAKWKPELSITKIRLNSRPLIENFEGKSGVVWRLSQRTTDYNLSTANSVQPGDIINISDKMDESGNLNNLNLPQGDWLILRMGHTSTGHENETGGGARGLECDKFNPEAVRIQFDNWFGAVYKHVDKKLLKRVLTNMHSDSWECGSQNWTPKFLEEFRQRRSYDLLPFLPLYAGIPIGSAEISESVLLDIRRTVAELINEVFFATMSELAKEKNCVFSSECVSPTMLSDGMLHYQQVDLPMGEYWLDSPTHDKPNDMADAISGAHIYGKNIVQAEGFTQLRGEWNEHPRMVKILGDFNFAQGMNKLFFHVYCHHPFVGKYPGMTLDGIGLFMQRGQTWWPYAAEWINYINRCQVMLQQGVPVNDIAVFTGEELPRRALLPDRLVESLPGLFGEEVLAAERERRANRGVPMHSTSVNVTASANMYKADQWIDPLRGYKYDSFNKDVFLRLARAENGRMILPGGASYRVLVFPEPHQMAPDASYMSLEVARKIKELQDAGVVVLLPSERPTGIPDYNQKEQRNKELEQLTSAIWIKAKQEACLLPFEEENMNRFGLEADILFKDLQGREIYDLAWNHRRDGETDIWFISNQPDSIRKIEISLRGAGRIPEWFDPQTTGITEIKNWRIEQGRTIIQLELASAQSGFVVLRNKTKQESSNQSETSLTTDLELDSWNIRFSALDKSMESPVLFDWRKSEDMDLKYYAGIAEYRSTFRLDKKPQADKIYLKFDSVNVMAEVFLNGKSCGIVWAQPYLLEVSSALKTGENELKINVANTWYNRVQAVNHKLIQEDDFWTNARVWRVKRPHSREGFSLQNFPVEYLQESGIQGDIKLLMAKPQP